MAFVTGPGGLDEASVKAALGRTLPGFMVPSRILHLEKIPLTVNGKVDKRNLPAVELGSPVAIVAPRNQGEDRLRQLYAEVLGLSESLVGVETSFLAMGGHSLKAVALLSAIDRQLGVQLRLASFLAASSIAEVARELDQQQPQADRIVSVGRTSDGLALPLTSSQGRIFAVQQLATWSTAYNIPSAWAARRGRRFGSGSRRRSPRWFRGTIRCGRPFRSSMACPFSVSPRRPR